MKDYRTISIEVLRDFALTQTETTSIRQVADDVGISHSAMHKFVTGRTDPQPRVRRLIGLWYLEKVDTAHLIDVARPFIAALQTLLTGVPEPHREEVTELILAAVELGISKGGEEVPRWTEALRSILETDRRKQR